jgi:predicted nucleotidyltransferase
MEENIQEQGVMIKQIKKSLARESQSGDVKILYACESGSRAWGFASPDSDYDVRFIYMHPRDWYLSLFDNRDVIEQPINDLLDISGWDLKKALLLLYKSNGALIEWLHSPVVYMHDSAILKYFRDLAARSFQPLSLCHHYLGMAKKGWDAVSGLEQVKLKRYFYTLRALLCAEWIVNRNSIAPVPFLSLLEEFYPSGEFRAAIDNLLLMKSESNESDLTARSQYVKLFEVIDKRIVELFDTLPDNLPKNNDKVERIIFDNAFREILNR